MIRELGKANAANADLKAELSKRAEALKAQIDGTLSMADQGLINAHELKLPANEYFDDFTRTINGIYEFNAVALNSLTDALGSRSRDLRQTAFGALGLLLVALAAAGALAWGIVSNINAQLGAEPEVAANLARAVADGDLTMAIHVRPGDTTSLIAQLKEMQTKLARVVSDIHQHAESVATASAQIAQGNNDLSART